MMNQQQMYVKRWKVVLCTILCLGTGVLVSWNGTAFAEENYFELLQVGRFDEPLEVPDFSLPLVGGEELTLSDYKGRVVFLNFWATWCPYCVDERAGLQALYEKYREQGLEIIAVSIDQGDIEKVKKFVDERELTFLNVHDKSSKTSLEYGVRGVPATIFIDPSGNALGGVIGPRDWRSDEARGLVEQLLAENKEALGF
jgi:peroxiredoxin